MDAKEQSVGKFLFYESFHKVLSKLDDVTYGRYARMIAEYMFENKEPLCDDVVWSVFWDMAKPLLDKTKQRSEIGRQGGMNGKGVSRNIGNQNAKKQNQNNSKTIAKQKQINSETKANQNQNNTKTIRDSDSDSDSDSDINTTSNDVDKKEIDKEKAETKVENETEAKIETPTSTLPTDTLEPERAQEKKPRGRGAWLEDLKIDEYVAPEFRDVFVLWLTYKHERNETYKPIGAKKCYSSLRTLSNGDAQMAALIIDQSMANNWAGIFALKQNYNQNQTTTNGNNTRNNRSDMQWNTASKEYSAEFPKWSDIASQANK